MSLFGYQRLTRLASILKARAEARVVVTATVEVSARLAIPVT
jgi:hypothetical protein